jgi:protein-L-isoaspartate(D-aspartate) O-methyltransferase
MGLSLILAGSLLVQEFAAERDRMVREQIEARGVHNRAVIESMRTTPRHRFVPESVRTQAYWDGALPIGYAQTISQPYIVGLMTELLEVSPSHKVLEIGTGSGYQAAVLSSLAKQVYSIEIVPELARSSAQLLRELGYRNVTVREGDGYKGWPEQSPFDRIILTAAPPEIPQALIDQLKPGGRLVAPEGRLFQELVIVEKDAAGKVKRTPNIAVRFVPMVRK